MQEVAARLAEVELFSQAARIWLAGGWAMVALALNALVLFALGVSIWLDFRGRGFRMRVDQNIRVNQDHLYASPSTIASMHTIAATPMAIPETARPLRSGCERRLVVAS